MEEKLNEIISYLMVIEQEAPNRELCKRIDSLIEISQAINYTRCCEELKDKEAPTFEEWLSNFEKTKIQENNY